MHLRDAILLLALPLAGSAPHIPETHAASLSGQPVDLPQALQNHTTVLIVGFSRNSRYAVAAWAHRLQADYRDSSTVQYYDLAILADVPRPLRSLVVGKMTHSIPPVAQPHSVLIYDHEQDWKSLAGYDKQGGADDAYLLLVDATGAVRDRLAAAASPTEQSYADLKLRLRQIHP